MNPCSYCEGTGIVGRLSNVPERICDHDENGPRIRLIPSIVDAKCSKCNGTGLSDECNPRGG